MRNEEYYKIANNKLQPALKTLTNWVLTIDSDLKTTYLLCKFLLFLPILNDMKFLLWKIEINTLKNKTNRRLN